MKTIVRAAVLTDLPAIWKILESAIQRRKKQGSHQWQDGYPNPEILSRDIELGQGYVLMMGDHLAAYCAILINDEPAYDLLQGQWLSEGDFVVFHRVAVATAYLGMGMAKKLLAYIEEFAIQKGIYSIKADTNFDNAAMLGLLEKGGYQYCGEVIFRGSPRMAFEKRLT